MQFLQPAMLAGAALFVVPLLIHLLNRQRHKKRPWAAMEFLLRAYQKQRNRLRNENLLLLLLRCLVPIALALAIARPLLDQAAALFAGGGIVHHVVVLDASYSMGVRPDGAPSPFERARAMIGRLFDGFEQNVNRSDKVTFVLAGVRPRFLTRNDLDLAGARNQWLLTQKPEDGAGDLADALQQVADALEVAADPHCRIYVFTDLQMRSLGLGPVVASADSGGDATGEAPTGTRTPDAAATAPAADPAAAPDFTDRVRDHVQRLQQRDNTELFCIDTGPLAAGRQGGGIDNVQIAGLRLGEPAAVLRTPVEFVAQLRNRGEATATCEVTLEIDGSEPMRKVVTVPAGAEGEADFQVVFREGGRRRVRVSLQNDALTADDEYFRTVDVRDRIRILLVDGEAGGDPLLSYAFAWKGRLDPDPSLLPTFAVEPIDIVALLGGQVRPKDYDLIVLADVERLNTTAKQLLIEALQAGRGLLIAVGERADASSYNLHLHSGGEGPQPVRLVQRLGGAPLSATYRTATMLVPAHPVFAEFEEDIYREVFQSVPIWRWYGVAADSMHPEATVLARLTDAESTPLLVARTFGDGKVVLLTSPLASELKPDCWNRLDEPILSFPLLHGLVQWLALPATDPFLASVGDLLTCSLPARPENVEVQRPERDGRPRAPIGEEPRPLPGDRYLMPSLADANFAGFYVFDLTLDKEAGKEPLSLPFAVNVDPAEGELRYAPHDDVRTNVGFERVLDGLPAVATTTDDPQRNELGPTLLLLTLLFVLGEAALARYVSVRRS